ncbi:ORF36 [Fowl aviadenovirus 2]|uniref:ORF36 n=1 Tax=Fowl aviadenovirus 2 TaxID=172859 RepID=A0A7G3VX80_9ADEN|nr:ORF36 [Fowl aviadenovirus 2]
MRVIMTPRNDVYRTSWSNGLCPRERKNAETTELILQYNFIENTDSWKGRVKGGAGIIFP